MDKAVAAAYRRRGFRVLGRIVAECLTPQRRVVGVCVAAATTGASTAAFFFVEWVPESSALDAVVAAFFALATTLTALWICLAVWLRRDRRGQESLTFLETGELGRVTREDGTLDIPEERRATVLRATEFQRPRVASAALLGFAPAVIGLAIAPTVVVLIVSGGNGWVVMLNAVLLTLSNAYFARTTIQSLGHLDAAHELAGSDTPPPAAGRTVGTLPS